MAKETYFTIDDLRHTAVLHGMHKAKAEKMIYFDLMGWLQDQNIRPKKAPNLNRAGKIIR